MSKDKEKIITEFENALLIPDTIITEGSLNSLSPGEKATITIQIPEEYKPTKSEPSTIYFAVKGKDDEGNVSSRFNVASATLGFKFLGTRSVPKAHDISTTTDFADEDLEFDESYEFQTDHDKKSSKLEDDEKSHETDLGPREDSELGGSTQNDSFKWWPVVVGIVIAITIVMFIVIVIIVIVKITRKRTYSSVHSQQC